MPTRGHVTAATSADQHSAHTTWPAVARPTSCVDSCHTRTVTKPATPPHQPARRLRRRSAATLARIRAVASSSEASPSTVSMLTTVPPAISGWKGENPAAHHRPKGGGGGLFEVLS